jgi:hypothetical protein
MEALGHIGLRTSLPLLTRDSITGSKIDVFFCRKALAVGILLGYL